jgi:two-component system response regulator AtoC
MKPSILVVDDDRSFRVLADSALVTEGFDVRTAASLNKARAEIDAAAPDVIILDRRLPDGDGIALLQELRDNGPLASLVIVVTAYGDIDSAVSALQSGAVDYLTKPIQVADLVVKIRKVLETRGLRDRLALATGAGTQPSEVLPRSRAMREVCAQLERVSESPLTPVLLAGPSGAGKQYAAELLHRLTYAGRDDAPFVDVNCAALPENLVESELFGHERGAFTDAKSTHRGLIEMASGGTLFLDEITELPEASQAKLLKFLDSMKLRRLGGQREIEVELRVIAATNREPREIVTSGGLREDLYHRLAVFRVNVPPLRERLEDIPLLAQSFVDYFSRRVKKRITGLSEDALDALRQYGFPGNVRELRNVIERGIILCSGPLLTARDIVIGEEREASTPASPRFFSVDSGADGVPPPLEAVERAYVARVLEHMGGRRMAAAQMLGISYPTFLKRLRELGFDSETDETK